MGNGVIQRAQFTEGIPKVKMRLGKVRLDILVQVLADQAGESQRARAARPVGAVDSAAAKDG